MSEDLGLQLDVVNVKELFTRQHIENLEKVRKLYIDKELYKETQSLAGSCLDGDKFNKEAHIEKIQQIARAKQIDNEFFKYMKDKYN